jgi:hypothetical protein
MPNSDRLLVSAFAPLLIVSSAGAGQVITGLAANTAFVGTSGAYCQLDLYVTFSPSAAFHRLGAVYATDFDLGGFGFGDCIHNDTSQTGGTWAPQAVLDPLDSFVTLGNEWGPGSYTGADPLWGGHQFEQPTIPPGAGWFAMMPPAMQGTATFVILSDTTGTVTYEGLASLAARFILPSELAAGATISLSAGVQWQYALDITGQDNVQGTFVVAPVPAPGVAFVWLAACLVARPRRR